MKTGVETSQFQLRNLCAAFAMALAFIGLPLLLTHNVAPSGASPFTPTSAPQSVIITHEPPPAVTAATVACTPSEVSAVTNGPGPYGNNPASWQIIINITSSSPCFVSGYPNVQFGSHGTIVPTSTDDGGYQGYSQTVANVTLSPSAPASFLIQGPEGPVMDGQCPVEDSLSFQLPGSSVEIPVDVTYGMTVACTTVNVTPFIQGNTVDQYF
jgi:hypothetical protein